MNGRHGMPNAIVAHAWVDEANSEEVLRYQAACPLVRGIRTKPVIAPGPDASVRGEPRSLQDPKWRRELNLLRKYGLSWDLRVPWWHLEEAAEVARELPDLPIALNHTGYPWNRDPSLARAVARRHAGLSSATECLLQNLRAVCAGAALDAHRERAVDPGSDRAIWGRAMHVRVEFPSG